MMVGDFWRQKKLNLIKNHGEGSFWWTRTISKKQNLNLNYSMNINEGIIL